MPGMGMVAALFMAATVLRVRSARSGELGLGLGLGVRALMSWGPGPNQSFSLSIQARIMHQTLSPTLDQSNP